MRLTKKRADNGRYYLSGLAEVSNSYPKGYGRIQVGHAVEKLAGYEDLEEQGKLLKLPCAVGDTIFHVCIPRNGEPKIVEMKVGCVEPWGAIRNHKETCEVWNVYAETDCTKAYFKFFDFSKTVFLTRGEAEAALERRHFKKIQAMAREAERGKGI